MVKRASGRALLLAAAAMGLGVFASTVGGGEAATLSSSCSLEGSTLRITIGSGESVSVVRSGDNFHVTGPGIADPTCGGATMNNVTIVVVSGAAGNETLTLSLSGGEFEPDDESDDDAGVSAAEIEFGLDLGGGAADALVVQGSNGADAIRLGANGINLNDDNDADVAVVNVEKTTVSGGNGNDVLNAAGGKGTGLSYPIPLTLNGENDRDKLTGGAAADVESGGTGNDSFVESATPEGGDAFNGGLGKDKVSYSARTTAVQVILDGIANDGAGGEADNVAADVEGVVGGKGGDTIDGAAAVVANSFDGKGGDDVLRGKAGTDALTGGGGFDNLQGGDGDDVLKARDSVDGENVDGGNNTDTCLADRDDVVVNCEN